ncbi:MAG TPA: hypothetical protein VMY35_16390 [Phycisphaerae bacterium]|nr:hypothetical protein [Phycisphaerae bacterium]
MHCAKCFFFETAVGDDVCNRCGRAYLPEANVYLGLAVLVTGGLAWALRALVTGSSDPFVRPVMDVGAWATWPVSIVECPAYGLVIGAALAMLAAVPILTGILYGKRGGWLLVLIIALVGPVGTGPTLSAMVVPAAVFIGIHALAVWIAAGQRLRMHSKLASGLAALVPVAVWWFVEAARSEPETLAPALRGALVVVPVAAVAFSAAAVALVVAVGWADNWHVRWPGALVAVLAAGPIMALVAFVGLDEVRYGFLASPRAGWSAPPPEAYEAFLARYPESRRSDEVRARLAEYLERLGSDAPPDLPAAPDLWRRILRNRPASPWAVDARLHLGDDAAARGAFNEAERHFREALARTDHLETPTVDPLDDFSVLGDLLTVGSAIEVKQRASRLQTVRQRVLMHLAVLEENHRPTEAAGRAMALYFEALAREGANAYRPVLLEARAADPDGPLADNIAYRLAKFEAAEVKRIEQLERVAETYPGTDGAMQARLAAAEALIGRADSDPGALRQARDELLRVRADLDFRRARNPQDPYVAALADTVGKKIAYVEAQLREPPPAAR